MDLMPYDEAFSPGDHLVLHLYRNTIFEGDYSDGGKHRIDLINTRQHNNPNKLGGVYSFYRNEIEKIHYFKVKQTERLPEIIVPERKNVLTIKMVEEEYRRLLQMSKDFEYISKADSRYYDAIKKLVVAENIGVLPLGLEFRRTARIKLLAVSTWKEVFLFDLIDHKHRYFYPELKEILESEYVCKVIHKGGPMVDILYRNYKIYVQKTFDTQVVDIILEKTKTGECPKNIKNLSECLNHYFNLPMSLLRDALEISEKQWALRPLNEEKKRYASQLVTYLIVLKEHMEKLLLEKTYETINKVHDWYYCSTDYEFAAKCKRDDISKELEHIIPSLKEQVLINEEDERESEKTEIPKEPIESTMSRDSEKPERSQKV